MLQSEYALNWLLECFSKPTVSLMDGLVMGAGAGISIHGTHRVAGERYAFAMPETGIGFFPDDGLAWIFARLPGHVGLYLGAGHMIHAPDVGQPVQISAYRYDGDDYYGAVRPTARIAATPATRGGADS